LPALRRPGGGHDDSRAEPAPGPETAYCAEVVAVTYEEMGLLAEHRSPSWYDPGRFWSGDGLDLAPGFRLGGEIAVTLEAALAPPRTAAAPTRRACRPALRWRRPRASA
jgi:hypothetical protein